MKISITRLERCTLSEFCEREGFDIRLEEAMGNAITCFWVHLVNKETVLPYYTGCVEVSAALNKVVEKLNEKAGQEINLLGRKIKMPFITRLGATIQNEIAKFAPRN